MQPIATHWWLWSGSLRLLLFELLMDQVICPSLISVMFRRSIHVLFVNPPRHCVHITQTLIVPLMSSHLNCSQCSFFSTAESPSKPEMMIKTKDKLRSDPRVWWSPHPIPIIGDLVTSEQWSVDHSSARCAWSGVAVKQGSDSFAPENCSPWNHLDIIHCNFDTSRAVQPSIILPGCMIYENSRKTKKDSSVCDTSEG